MLSVELSLNPQAEAGVPAVAVKVFIEKNGWRNQLKTTSALGNSLTKN